MWVIATTLIFLLASLSQIQNVEGNCCCCGGGGGRRKREISNSFASFRKLSDILLPQESTQDTLSNGCPLPSSGLIKNRCPPCTLPCPVPNPLSRHLKLSSYKERLGAVQKN
ncbi:hypothetical protein Ddc_14250 [Ditylenchus destructor]|nr:hypothetical protein Ddc_14250 [Ditylenchus destructor]